MRKRIHIEVNAMKLESGLGANYSLGTARTFAERNETIRNWIEQSFNIDDPASARGFKKSLESSEKYYKISTTVDDILEQMNMSTESSFFSRNRIRSNERIVQGFRKFYDIGNGLENDILFDNELVKKGLKLKKIRYTNEEGVTDFYDQNDLNPQTNPTVTELTEEEWNRATKNISTPRS